MLKNRNHQYPPLANGYQHQARDSNLVQHRHLNRVRQSAAAVSSDDKPLNDDNDFTVDYDEDGDVRELNILKGLRVKSSAGNQNNFAADDEEQTATNGRRLDWRLGQKINALMDTGKNGGIVLGKGTAKDLKFEWLITPWSECSQPCGTGVGFRVSIKIILLLFGKFFLLDCFPLIMATTTRSTTEDHHRRNSQRTSW